MGLLVTGSNAAAPIVSVGLQDIIYGFSTCTFAIAVWVLVFQKGARVNYGMLLVACALWTLSTIRMVLDIYLTTRAFVSHLSSGSLGPEEWLSSFNHPSSLLDNAIYGLQTLIGDGVVIYRCYSVWNNWIIIMFPSLCWLAALGSILYVLDTSAKGQTGPQILIFYSLTLAANLSATLALAYRIWRVDNEARGIRTSRSTRVSPLRPILIVIVESGLIYSVLLILGMITVTHAIAAEFIVNSIIPAVIGLTFDMIFIRIGIMRLASRSGTKTDTTFPLSAIVFRESSMDHTGPRPKPSHSELSTTTHQQSAAEITLGAESADDV